MARDPTALVKNLHRGVGDARFGVGHTRSGGTFGAFPAPDAPMIPMTVPAVLSTKFGGSTSGARGGVGAGFLSDMLQASREKILRGKDTGTLLDGGPFMVTSKTIAGLVGPTLVAVAAALLLNLGSISAVLEPLSRDPALVLIYGIFLFVAGLAIVRVHNRWTGDWSVLVTTVGFLSLAASSVCCSRSDSPQWLVTLPRVRA
jgi:hypothetical protein